MILLTGGSRGIGAATVRALHAQQQPCVFTYREGEEAARALCTELGSGVEGVRCDLADSQALPPFVDSLQQRFGAIDTLINNAAVFDYNPFFGTSYDHWREGWQRTFAINLFGTVNLSYLLLQQMRERKRGRIINIVSRAAHRGELEFADYGASKAALVNFTKSTARTCAKEGIVSIAIAPGFIMTDMAQHDMERRGAEITAEIPLGYVGSPEEVASIVAFFASGKGDYANGATIDVNGGSYVR